MKGGTLNMASLNEQLIEYGKLIKETDIQEAYKGLMQFMTGLRNSFKENHPEYDVSANLYQGYMDLTFFSLTTEMTKEKDLKYMVVFIHEKMQFQVWLSGRNRKVMSAFHDKFSTYALENYTLTDDIKGMSAIIEGTLSEEPDFDHLSELTNHIETGVMNFIQDIEKNYLSSE